MKIEMSCVEFANIKILITCFFQLCDDDLSKHARNIIFFSLQASFRSDYLSHHLFHQSTIRRVLLTETSIIEQIIAKVEIIETNATNVKIWRRKSKERRRCKRKSKWEFWWESWLQQDVKDVCSFVWRRDRFLWQNKSKTIKRKRFRERMLLKTLRFWTFQTLTNRRLLIDCRQKVDDDSWLICRWESRLTSVNALRRWTTILMLMQIKWFRLFTKHANQIIDCKMKLLRFSKHWCKCCERSERCISRQFWWCNWSRNREFWSCFWWDCCWDRWWSWWNCCWTFISLSIEVSFRSDFNYLLRMMLTNVLVKSVVRFKDFFAMLAHDFLANWLIVLQQANQEREKREAIQTRVILRRRRSKSSKRRSLNLRFRRRFRRKCCDQDF